MSRKKVFASYCREDGDIVKPVIALLRTTKSEVFWDVDSVKPGRRWMPQLERALHRASLVIVFWTRNAAMSSWVRSEWENAIHAGKEILPLLLDSTPLPHPLREYQYIDFRPLLEETHPKAKKASMGFYYYRRDYKKRRVSLYFIVGILGITISVVLAQFFPKLDKIVLSFLLKHLGGLFLLALIVTLIFVFLSERKNRKPQAFHKDIARNLSEEITRKIKDLYK